MPKILNEREQAFITELSAVLTKFGAELECSHVHNEICVYAGSNYDAVSDTYGDSIILPELNSLLN